MGSTLLRGVQSSCRTLAAHSPEAELACRRPLNSNVGHSPVKIMRILNFYVKGEISMKPVHYAVKFFLSISIFITLYSNVLASSTDYSDIPVLFAKIQKSGNNQASSVAHFATPQAMSSSASASFVRFFRYPIEPPTGYLTMDEIEPAPTPTAYYRDVYMGAETILSVSGPVASKSWQVDLLTPDNETLHSTIQFFSSYNGKENCFVSDNFTFCGATTGSVKWYTSARCAPSGSYTMTFFEDGNQYDQRQFKLLPQIKEGKVPLYNQDDYPTQLMGGGIPFLRPTIQSQGCALTSLAMVLAYHGITGPNGTLIKPDELNQMLIEADGYTFWRNQIKWFTVNKITGGKVKFAPELIFNFTENHICDYGPQMVGAEGSLGLPNTHWMVATGLNENNDYLVNDPKNGRDKFYGESWETSNSTRGLIGPGFVVTDPSGISIYLHSPAELLLTDPQGRKLGLDPVSGESFKEIPKSYYELTGLTDQVTGQTEEPSKELTFSSPINGEYILEVIGTGSGDYNLEVHAMDSSLQQSSALVEQVPIIPNERHSYRFYFSGGGSTPLEFVANFNGGGQNAKVNRLLSYNAPTTNQTRLSLGTSSYTTYVFYSRNIQPQSFHAIFNGTDISSMFHPIPGTNERVTLPLIIGRNLLHLSVEGDVDGRIATDSDRLTFVVP